LSDVQVVFGYQETFVDLLVLIHAPDFEVSPKWGVLKVPFTGDSSKCEFSLTPKKLGTRRIEVELLQVADRRGYTYFTTQVVEKGKQVGQATASKIESTSNRDLLRRGLTRAVIYVEWQRGAGLNYQVLNPARGSVEPEPAGLSAGNFTLEQAREWVAQQGSIIKDYLRQDYETEADLRGALSNIAAIGHGLFQQLVPKEIVQLAKDWPPGSVIAIDTNESWIPWELIHDDADGDFWGERFQIVRIPRVPPGSEEEVALIVPAPAVTPECLEIQKIVSVVGDEIMVGNEVGNYSVERTFGEASRYVTDIVQGTFDELQVALRDAEVVHFTCHGRTQPIYHLSYGPGPGRRLLIPQVDQLPIKPGAMIFANACASNQPELLLNEFQSFGWHFFVCGARPYIGTLGPVPIKHAITFAECFYKHFITEGLPAGLALRQAKRDVRKQYRNPFWLFYCLYGPASACMRLRPI